MDNVIEQEVEYYTAQKGEREVNEDKCVAALPLQSSLLTPKQELVHAHVCNSSESSYSTSSDMSAKEGFYSSLLSPEFDSESYSSSPAALRKGEIEFVDTSAKQREEKEYVMVLNSIIHHENEVTFSYKKIHFSEEEIQRLEYDVRNNPAVMKLIVFLKLQLDLAESEVHIHKDDLERDEWKIQELQKQVSLLETQISNGDYKIEKLESELEMTREKLEEEVARLRHDCSKVITENTCYLAHQLESTQEELASVMAKLDSKERHASELEEIIMGYKENISGHDKEMRRISAVLEDAQENLCIQEEQLQAQITSLSEQQAMLEARNEELEMQNRSLQRKVSRCEADKVEMKTLHEVQEIKWKAETECLKLEVNKKCEELQALNKDLDNLKLEYDSLAVKTDEVNAKVQILGAELRSRDIQIQEMEDHLIAGSESAQKSMEELRLRVEELQKEVERQTLVISDRAEEKREAIRQLCFSLEYYRSGYQELLRAYSGRTRHALISA